MGLPVINTQMTDKVAYALCNTLLHSLWQGVLLAAAVGLIIIFTKKASPALRYNLLVWALGLFAAGVAFTFIVQITAGQPMQTAHTSNFLTKVPENALWLPTNYAATPSSNNFNNTLSAYISSHYNIIVLVWFLIICAKSIQFGVGLHNVYRLKNINVFAVPYYLQQRLQQLAAMLRVKQGVMLLQSGLAQVPMVVGHLKPVILLPVGLLTRLSPEELEAILLHELAHVRRRDYLVNLLQSFMEIVFFFNPAVLWVSQLLKAERENCCDDLALGRNNDKANYIRALLYCEEHREAAPAHAMAFPGGKHGLLQRVKRITGSHNRTLGVAEKTVLAVCLVVAGICISAFSKQDTDKKQTSHAVLSATKNVAPIANPVKQHALPDAAKIIIKSELNRNVKVGATGPIAHNDTITVVGMPLKQARDSSVRTPINNTTDKQATPITVFGMGRSDSTEQDTTAQPKFIAYDYRAYRLNYPYGRYGQRRPDEDSINFVVKAIKADMLQDGIIKGVDDNIKFTLRTNELVVNGVKVSDALFARYKQKYVPANADPSWSWGHAHTR